MFITCSLRRGPYTISYKKEKQYPRKNCPIYIHVKQTRHILKSFISVIYYFRPSTYYNFDEELQEERGVSNQTLGENLLYAYEIGRQKKNCEGIYSKCIISIIDVISRKYLS